MAVARQAAATGVKEIVLTGINIGDYGKATDGLERTEENLLALIAELDTIPSVERWRISSIEPNLLTTEIMEFVAAHPRWMPHFHIPLQSGSDKILKYMRRKYLTPLYRERVETIRRLMPNACIGVDVIVGFPGETAEDFEETYNFIASLDVSYLHVFTYSERANTKALNIAPIVPMTVRKERNERLRILSEKKKRAFYEQYVGATMPILWEQENDEGIQYGFTENYIKVGTPYDAVRAKTISTATIAEIHRRGYGVAQVGERMLVT